MAIIITTLYIKKLHLENGRKVKAGGLDRRDEDHLLPTGDTQPPWINGPTGVGVGAGVGTPLNNSTTAAMIPHQFLAMTSGMIFCANVMILSKFRPVANNILRMSARPFCTSGAPTSASWAVPLNPAFAACSVSNCCAQAVGSRG